MKTSRRELIAGLAASTLASRATAAQPVEVVTPEMFGARGDGKSNDTAAFAAMSAHVNARSGGIIALRPVTYMVGQQRPGPGGNAPSYIPADIIRLTNCAKPIVIRGNGATLRCAPGLRFGRWDSATGQPFPDASKADPTNKAIPYFSMITIEKCSGSIEISDIELDGDFSRMRIGGKAAYNGWQAGGTGIRLLENRASERLSNISSHHHPQDGIILTPALDRTGQTTVTDVTCDYNGRQGCTVSGGRNFVFMRCRFRHTGQVVFHSAPAAGVDIEAESPFIRNVAFFDCEFSNNYGFGVGSGTGDSADISFSRCKFVGTNFWAVGPNSPRMRFDNCLIAGAINYVRGDPDPDRAVQFLDCTFVDDPSFSPTGKLFLGLGPLKWIVVAPKGENVLFSRCRFRLTGDALLPLSKGVIYADCDMLQSSPTASGPEGTYIGTNTIRGKVILERSTIRGTVTLNGRVLPRTV